MTSRRGFGLALGVVAINMMAARLQQRPVSPDSESEIEARYANALRMYGDRLSEPQRRHLRKILEQNQRMLNNVRSFPIENADPPATIPRFSSPE